MVSPQIYLGVTIIRRKDNGRPFRGLRGFDYATFFRQALDYEVVGQSEEMRRAITNVIWIRYEKASVPEMIRLLDDPELSIRRAAVAALRKCVNSDFSNSWDRRDFFGRGTATQKGPEKKLEKRLRDYAENEQEYIQYWRKWWQENKDRFITRKPLISEAD